MNILAASRRLLFATSLACVASSLALAQEPTEPGRAEPGRPEPGRVREQPQQQAQQAQQAQERPTAASPAPLVIQTGERDVAEGVVEALGTGEEQLPDLPEGHHWVLKLEGKEKLTITTAAGAVPHVSLTARPAAVMDIYEEQVDQAVQMGQALAQMGMQQAGVTGAEAGQIVQELVAFPRQIATLKLEMSRSKETAKQVDIAIDVVPETDSALARTWRVLQPNEKGVPVLAGPQPPLLLQLSVAPSVLASYADTIARFSATVSPIPAAQRTDYIDVQKRMLTSLDGTMTLALANGVMRFVAGLQQPDQLRKELESQRYQQILKQAAEASANTHFEFHPNAFEHDGVKVHETTVDMQGAGGMGGDSEGRSRTWIAVAGEYLVGLFLSANEAPINALIDRAQQKQMERAPLPAGTVLVADLRPAELQRLAVPGAAPGGAAAGGAEPHGNDQADDHADEQMPDRVRLTVEKTDIGLRLGIHAEGTRTTGSRR